MSTASASGDSRPTRCSCGGFATSRDDIMLATIASTLSRGTPSIVATASSRRPRAASSSRRSEPTPVAFIPEGVRQVAYLVAEAGVAPSRPLLEFVDELPLLLLVRRRRHLLE